MKTIKSSEIASYVFCPVSWWIGRTKGIEITEVMNEGERYHNLVSENQIRARFLYVCIVIVLFIIATLIMYKFLI